MIVTTNFDLLCRIYLQVHNLPTKHSLNAWLFRYVCSLKLRKRPSCKQSLSERWKITHSINHCYNSFESELTNYHKDEVYFYLGFCTLYCNLPSKVSLYIAIMLIMCLWVLFCRLKNNLLSLTDLVTIESHFQGWQLRALNNSQR